MPNPRFEPLTLSQEEWLDLSSRSYVELVRECEAQAQAAASLRQRLEERDDAITHLASQLAKSELDLKNHVEALRGQLAQEQQDSRLVVAQLEQSEAARSKAEAALEEMQKWVENYLKELDGDYPSPDREVLQEVLAELQRRRSPTGQQQG